MSAINGVVTLACGHPYGHGVSTRKQQQGWLSTQILTDQAMMQRVQIALQTPYAPAPSTPFAAAKKKNERIEFILEGGEYPPGFNADDWERDFERYGLRRKNHLRWLDERINELRVAL